jgi:hypothetical protein
MSSATLVHPDAVPERREGAAGVSRAVVLAGIVLFALLLAAVPLFLRMPVWCDVTHYDLAARNVLRGGVHYRDVFDTNLPGMLWLHVGIRSLLGWSSEAIRLVDLGIVSAIVWLLVRWGKDQGWPHAGQVWTAVALYAFYLSTAEINHCQRDTWMLLPALLALYLRRDQVAGLSWANASPGQTAGRAVAEGLCWGAAFWIKPFVIVPGLLCWAVGAAWVWRRAQGRGMLVLLDAVGILGGGLVAGAVGAAWLWWSGAWPCFWDVMSSWNGEYARQSSGAALGCTLPSLYEFLPWSAVHFIATPVALTRTWQALIKPPGPSSQGQPNTALQDGLLGSFYLGWLVQASCLQHGSSYHHVPPILLGMVLTTRWCGLMPTSHLGWLNRFLCVGVVVASLHPALNRERLSLWGRCLWGPSTPELRDRLALTDAVTWQDLHRVREFLRNRGLHDGELTCYGSCTNPLYLELNLEPSIRYTQFSMFVHLFPTRRGQMRHELAATGQRYIVTDVQDWSATHPAPEDPPGAPSGPPASAAGVHPGKAQRYPWNEPVVFRAGRYCVHRVTGPPGSF